MRVGAVGVLGLVGVVVGTGALPAARAQTTVPSGWPTSAPQTVNLLTSSGSWAAWYRSPHIVQSSGSVRVEPASDGYGAIMKLTDGVLGGASVTLRAVIVSDDGRALSNANANGGLQAYSRPGIVGSAPISVVSAGTNAAVITAVLRVRDGRAASVLAGFSSVGGPWHLQAATLTISGGSPYDGDDDTPTTAPATVAPTSVPATTRPVSVPATTAVAPPTTGATTIPVTTKPIEPPTTVRATTTVPPTTTKPPVVTSCMVRLRRVWDTENGFGGRITITNTGDDVNNWNATWHWPTADVYYFDVWNAFLTAYTGRDATVRAAFWNAHFKHGDSIEMGYTLAGSPQIPENITFNGAQCTLEDAVFVH